LPGKSNFFYPDPRPAQISNEIDAAVGKSGLCGRWSNKGSCIGV